MADTHETIADVVAWLRRPREGENAYLTLWRDEIADRIEAAHKRELSKNVSKNGADFGQLGDAAKLREALVSVQKKIHYLIGSLNVPNSLVANRMEINGIINAALAAPPRNCDLPEVAKDSWRAWLDDKSNWDEFGSPKLEIHDWLLALSTEKEGGNNANK